MSIVAALQDLRDDRRSYFGYTPLDIINIIVEFLRWDGAPVGIYGEKFLNLDNFHHQGDFYENLILYLTKDGTKRICDFITGEVWDVHRDTRSLLSRDEYLTFGLPVEKPPHLAINIRTGATRIIEKKTGFAGDEFMCIAGVCYANGSIYTDVNRNLGWCEIVKGSLTTGTTMRRTNVHPDLLNQIRGVWSGYESLHQFRYTNNLCISTETGNLFRRGWPSISCDYVIEHPRGAIIQCGQNVIFISSTEPGKRVELFKLNKGESIAHIFGNMLIIRSQVNLRVMYLEC